MRPRSPSGWTPPVAPRAPNVSTSRSVSHSTRSAMASRELARLVELVALDALRALEGAPAEVLRRLVGLEQHAVDLLEVVLADVADPQLAERGVEREAPRVAQAGQDDVPARLRLADVGGEDL